MVKALLSFLQRLQVSTTRFSLLTRPFWVAALMPKSGNMSIGKTETEVESLRRELKLSKEATRLELQEVKRKAKYVIEKSSKEVRLRQGEASVSW